MSADLVVAPCSYKAAKFAVEHWHYSGVMPAGKTVKFGVWESEQFVGAVIYGMGSGRLTDGRKYGLAKTHEVAELARVALTNHDFFTSIAISRSIKLIKKSSPRLRLIISFSDYGKEQHVGTLYQACNFIFAGRWESPNAEFEVNGSIYHRRTIGAKGWSQSVKWLRENIDKDAKEIPSVKFRYLYPLDRAMRRQIEPLAQPYPKHADVVKNGNTPGDQPENAGSIPAVRSVIFNNE